MIAASQYCSGKRPAGAGPSSFVGACATCGENVGVQEAFGVVIFVVVAIAGVVGV